MKFGQVMQKAVELFDRQNIMSSPGGRRLMEHHTTTWSVELEEAIAYEIMSHFPEPVRNHALPLYMGPGGSFGLRAQYLILIFEGPFNVMNYYLRGI
jgi:hypothetical protein